MKNLRRLASLLTLAVLAASCGGGGGGGSTPTVLTASGGGTSVVVPGSTFESFVTLTAHAGNAEFAVTSITAPPSGPPLTGVLVNTTDHPGLVTADVPVGFVGPSTITIAVSEATATESQEVALTLEAPLLTVSNTTTAAGDGSVLLACNLTQFFGVTLTAPAGFLPFGTTVEFFTTPVGSDGSTDRLGVRLGDAPAATCSVALPSALFPDGTVPVELTSMMASPLDGSMWSMAPVTVGADAEVSLDAGVFGDGTEAASGGTEYATLLNYAGLAPSSFGKGMLGGSAGPSSHAVAGVLLTKDTLLGTVSVAATLVVNNGVFDSSQSDGAAFWQALNQVDDLAILFPGFNATSMSGLTDENWYSAAPNRDPLTTWLLEFTDNPETLFGGGGVLVVAYDTFDSLDDEWVGLPDLWKGTVTSTIELMNYLIDGQPAGAGERDIDIVCHSMGGLVARDTLMQFPDFRTHIEHFVTLASPHEGTLFGGTPHPSQPFGLPTQGGLDMLPFSSYISGLASSAHWDDLLDESLSGIECWALSRSDDLIVLSDSALPGEYLTERLLLDGSGTLASGHIAIHSDLSGELPLHKGTSNPGADPATNPSLADKSVQELLGEILGLPEVAPNDSCDTPAFIFGNGPFSVDTRHATGGIDADPLCGSGLLHHDVWFAWTAGATGTVEMDVCNADFDTFLALWRGHGPTGAGCGFNPFDLYACNDDYCGQQSRISYPVVQGETYMVQVGGHGIDSVGTGTLFIDVTPDGPGPTGGMVQIPAGTFVMGDHQGLGQSDELPLHTVTLDSFYMDVFETTNEQYRDYLNSALDQGLIEVSGGIVYKAGGTEPYCSTDSASSYSRIVWTGSSFTVESSKLDHPMNEVSWYGAVAFANWRSAQDGLTPCYNLSSWACNFSVNGCRLPTEAEWEYAARGGEYSPYYTYPWGDMINGSHANYWQSGDPFETGSYPYSTPVGYFDGSQIPNGGDMANEYGLYDTVGNAWEWCNDWYGFSYYDSSPASSPHGPATGFFHTIRGGSCFNDLLTTNLHTARRVGTGPDLSPVYGRIGFRLARITTK